MVRDLDDAQRARAGASARRRARPPCRYRRSAGPRRRASAAPARSSRRCARSAAPSRRQRMARDDLDAVDGDAIAAVDVRPPRAGAPAPPARSARERLEPRHRNALPHLARPELAEDRAGAADVIGIAVRQREVVEPPESGVAQDRRDDAVADVERGRRRQAAGVDQQRRAARERRTNAESPWPTSRNVTCSRPSPRATKRARIGQDPDRRAAARVGHRRARTTRRGDARLRGCRLGDRRRHSAQQMIAPRSRRPRRSTTAARPDRSAPARTAPDPRTARGRPRRGARSSRRAPRAVRDTARAARPPSRQSARRPSTGSPGSSTRGRQT